MSTSSNTTEFHFEGIDVDAIEKQLASMRREARTGSGITDSIAISDTRACVLNLIIYVDVEDECDATYQMLEDAQAQNPGRFFFLVVNRKAAQPRLETRVEVKCRRLESGRAAVCGEQVTLHVDGDAVYTSPSAIAPLLIPDVPVYLLWPNPPNTTDKLWDQLSLLADRIIVDSTTFDKPATDLRFLSAVISKNPTHLKVTDLNWSGLMAWRGLIASFWDVPSYRNALDSVDKVSITYQADPNGCAEMAVRPLLLAGWLVSRLGWQIVESNYSLDSIEAILESNKRRITLSILPKHHGPNCQGLVTSLRLMHETTSFEVSISNDSLRLSTEVRIDDSIASGRTLSYEIPSGGQRINNELSMLSRDTVFEASLISAAGFFKEGDNG